MLLSEKSPQDTLSAQCCSSYINDFKLQEVYLKNKNMQLGQKLIDKTKGYGRTQVTQENTGWCEQDILKTLFCCPVKLQLLINLESVQVSSWIVPRKETMSTWHLGNFMNFSRFCLDLPLCRYLLVPNFSPIPMLYH